MASRKGSGSGKSRKKRQQEGRLAVACVGIFFRGMRVMSCWKCRKCREHLRYLEEGGVKPRWESPRDCPKSAKELGSRDVAYVRNRIRELRRLEMIEKINNKNNNKYNDKNNNDYDTE